MALVHGAQEPLGVRDGLVLYLDAANARSYPRSGNTWFDRSGNNNHGTLNGGIGYSGSNFGSLSFDGTDDYVSTTNSFTNPQVFTIGAWFKTSTASGKKIIGFENVQTEDISWYYDRMLYMGNDGKIYFGIYDGNTNTAASTSTLNDGNWHYIVGRYGGEGTTMRLYVDGISNATGTSSSAQGYTGWWRIASYALNGWPPGSSGFFTGNIGLVQIYNRALSAAEIQQNYNALKGRYGLS